MLFCTIEFLPLKVNGKAASPCAIASFPLVFERKSAYLLFANVDPGQRGKKPKHIQEPHHHGDDDDRVHDRPDGGLHGDKTIHQPQENAHYDQGHYDLQ
jgi:hypothetical protein